MEVLILDSDLKPLGLAPWRRALADIIAGRVKVLKYYADQSIRCVGGAARLPSIVKFVGPTSDKYVRHEPKFNRANVWQRDGGACCYCDQPVPRLEFTYDHVLPISKGGKTTWENIVTCCAPCNTRKAAMSPDIAGMPLLRTPYRPKMLPKYEEVVYFCAEMPPEWRKFLPDVDSDLPVR